MYQQRRQWRFTWRGREVHSPTGRFFVGAWLLIVGVPLLLLGFLMLIITIPLSLPFHFIVRAFDGRGFWDPATGKYDVPTWVGFPIIVLVALVIVSVIL